MTTTPDVTAPVPDVANLPVITNYCGVLSAEIATPTATDNCNGTITGTTSDPLDYTAVGTYVITWSYDDGNGNTSTQAQTIIVEASPLDQVTFDDATFVYNTGVQAIEVDNLPAGAQVTYTTTPATGSDNGAVNAGVYTVTATLTPPAEAFNCEAVTLTATLTIDRAPQTITFDPLAVRNLETDPDFQLGATASSGLPVSYTYSYTSPQAPAMVTPEGFVDMLTSGEVLITAHQEGNENYLPAESVDQLLIIESSDATIGLIIIGDESHENPAGEIYYLIDCDDTSESVEVSIVAEVGATVTPGLQFSIATPVPGIYTQEVTVISQDGTNSAVYTITVEKRFDFFAIVEQKFDNVLLVNNNPATNGGYKFTAYQWFRNGQPIGTGQYYSAGDNMHDRLDPTAEYYVKMTTVEGDVLQTCVAQITFEHAYASRLYPNPSAAGRFITVEADFPQAELDNMHIRVYSLTGSLVSSVEGAGAVTRVKLPDTLQDGTYIVVLETPNQRKSLKVIVRN
ncbi:T9SS type A sorting domain-containing protein [Nostoc linckia]|uniref:T9SS type A sorting domain-containing protein n=1 Tax=Nostoc linckia TaxID=92942 RepID=UPI00211DC601